MLVVMKRDATKEEIDAVVAGWRPGKEDGTVGSPGSAAVWPCGSEPSFECPCTRDATPLDGEQEVWMNSGETRRRLFELEPAEQVAKT